MKKPTASGAGDGEPEWDAGVMSQLTSMGFPETRCKKAMLATGMGDAESAMNWLFAHMEDADIDDPIDFSAANAAASSGAAMQDQTPLCWRKWVLRPPKHERLYVLTRTTPSSPLLGSSKTPMILVKIRPLLNLPR